MTRFHVITRKLTGSGSDSGHLAESTIVPGAYWDSMSAGERLEWTVTNTFFAPADDSEVAPFLQKLTGAATGQAICLFKVMDAEKGRFGMVPGRTCTGSIGVLFVAALEEHRTADFNASPGGFDLCVARRGFQGKLVVDDLIVEPLQLKTRVTIGSPCGLSSGIESGMWEVAFYALRYPQARGIGGIPPGGECPWQGSFQLNSKCFLRPKPSGAHKLDFFSAHAACRGLAEGTGYAPEDASLAIIDNDLELKFVGVSIQQRSSLVLVRRAFTWELASLAWVLNSSPISAVANDACHVLQCACVQQHFCPFKCGQSVARSHGARVGLF